MVRTIFGKLYYVNRYNTNILSFYLLINVNFVIGGSTPCCQGGAGPAPLQETLCGYFFNTQGIGAADAAYHLPICGEYYKIIARNF